VARSRGGRRAPLERAVGATGARLTRRRAAGFLQWGTAIAVVGGVAWWFSAREAPAARLYREGRELQAQGQRAAAIGRYEQVLAADPSRVDARFFLGQSLLADNRVSDAIPHLNAAVTAGVRPDVAPFDLARALASTGDQAAAQRALARLKIPPQADTGSFVTAGQFAEALRDLPLAIQFYAQANQRADVPSAVVERLGVLLATSRRTGEAIAVLERGIARAPSEASLHLNLAVVLAQEGRLAEARARLREALRLRPDYPQAKALAERLGA
jgi:tetratricopeptide (TPR) repeat protein